MNGETIFINRPHLETYTEGIVTRKGNPDFKFKMVTGSVEITNNLCIHRNAHGSISLMKRLPVLFRLVDEEPKSLFTKIKEWIWK